MIKIVQSSCQVSELCFKTNSYGDCVRSSRSGVAGSVNFPDKLCGARVPYVKCPGAVDGFGNRNCLEEAMGGTGGSGSSQRYWAWRRWVTSSGQRSGPAIVPTALVWYCLTTSVPSQSARAYSSVHTSVFRPCGLLFPSKGGLILDSASAVSSQVLASEP